MDVSLYALVARRAGDRPHHVFPVLCVLFRIKKHDHCFGTRNPVEVEHLDHRDTGRWVNGDDERCLKLLW